MLPQCAVQSKQTECTLHLTGSIHVKWSNPIISVCSQDFEASLLDTMCSSCSSLQIYGASKGSSSPYCRSNSNPINLALQILKFHTYKTAENVERRGEERQRDVMRGCLKTWTSFSCLVCSNLKTLTDMMASEDKFVSSVWEGLNQV